MPVLVVGNLVVGGAGKTPTVIAAVQALRAAGHRPGVISRGYGRRLHGTEPRAVGAHDRASEAGDEPLLIARRTGVPVWVGRDRPACAAALCKQHPEVDVLVCDDGLQHQALARQAEWVVFDERGLGNGLLLPAGPLRQSLPDRPSAITRVLYNAPAPSTPLPGWVLERQANHAWPLAAWWAGENARHVPLQSLRDRPLLAVAGLAAPQKFFAMLRAAGLQIQPLALPDHHAYAELPWAPDTPDVITTEKDAVKLDPMYLPGLRSGTRVWVVPLDLDLPAILVTDLLSLLFPAPDAPGLPSP